MCKYFGAFAKCFFRLPDVLVLKFAERRERYLTKFNVLVIFFNEPEFLD